YPKAFQVPADSIRRINTAVIAARLDTNSQNDTASAVVTIHASPPPTYDLEVISTVAPDTVFQGQEFTYFLQVINHGPDDATDVDLTDSLPDSIFVNMFNRTPPANLLARVLKWNFAALDSGQMIEIEFTATFPDSIKLPPGFLRREKRSSISAQFDSNPANNTASAVVYVRPKESAYDLQLTKSVTPTRVLQGQQFTYRIDVVNNGPNTVQEFSILDALPDGVAVSAFSLQPTNPFAADTLRWRIDTPLSPGARFEISYTGMCETAGGLDSLVKINTAFAAAPMDTMLGNNSDTTLVTCIQPPNVCAEFVLLDRSVFEPGTQGSLKITVDVGSITDITVGIFDITGYPIKDIPTTNARTGKNTFLWDGRSNDGQAAGSGVYIIVARDRASNGALLECVQKVLVVR
ncbi:MAG: FlgD immunoglobulin-like domain containing protein, partial [bacterium]